MSRSCTDLIVNLNDALTPSSFSTILVQLIKYIAYNSKSIPFSYEGFEHLVKRKRFLLSNNEKLDIDITYNDIVANNFFVNVSEVYDNYEATFKSIWEEFKSHDRLKQVILLLGDTLIHPRCSYRIQTPFLCRANCENAPPVRKPLETILKSLIESSHMNSVFESCREPSNIFILIEFIDGHNPNTEWFVPFDNFASTSMKKEIKIVLDSPSSSTNTSLDDSSTSSSYQSDNERTKNINIMDELDTNSNNWYRSKVPLKGFKDKKIGGKSMFNYLLSS